MKRNQLCGCHWPNKIDHMHRLERFLALIGAPEIDLFRKDPYGFKRIFWVSWVASESLKGLLSFSRSPSVPLWFSLGPFWFLWDLCFQTWGFLSDPGIPGVRSMGLSLSNWLTHLWQVIQFIQVIQVIQVIQFFGWWKYIHIWLSCFMHLDKIFGLAEICKGSQIVIPICHVQKYILFRFSFVISDLLGGA